MNKLTDNDVRNILLDHFECGLSVKEIAVGYAVSETTIRDILKRKTRKNVTIK